MDAPGREGAEHQATSTAARERARLDRALARAHALIARREHSVAELRAALERARLDQAAIEQALAIVVEQGYVDDARYARLVVEDRRTLDGWGVERIRARLEAAAIDRALIEELLEPFDAACELAAAGELIRRRCTLPLSGARECQRAFGMLMQRGYDSDVAYDAVRAASVDA